MVQFMSGLANCDYDYENLSIYVCTQSNVPGEAMLETARELAAHFEDLTHTSLFECQ